MLLTNGVKNARVGQDDDEARQNKTDEEDESAWRSAIFLEYCTGKCFWLVAEFTPKTSERKKLKRERVLSDLSFTVCLSACKSGDGMKHKLLHTHHNEKCNKPCEEQLNDDHFRRVDFRI